MRVRVLCVCAVLVLCGPVVFGWECYCVRRVRVRVRVGCVLVVLLCCVALLLGSVVVCVGVSCEEWCAVCVCGSLLCSRL